MLFPNAGVPTAPTAESRRLSERFSSRLCTELQNGLEELVIRYAAFKMRWRGLAAFSGLPVGFAFPFSLPARIG